MFDKTTKRQNNKIENRGIWVAARQSGRPGGVRSMGTWMAVLALAVGSQVSGETVSKTDFVFENAVDNSTDLLFFGSAPAINNAGAVGLEAAGTGFETGSVWKWHNGALTMIATSKKGFLTGFGDTVVINSSGRVGFNARVPATSDTIIASGDGGPINVLASANQQGLVGGQFFGIGGMNESGAAVFIAHRRGSPAQGIFVAKDGNVTAVVDTATDPRFQFLGNADIAASGKVVFHGFPPDGSEGIYLATGEIVADTNNPAFTGFLDPVINDAGIVGGGAFLGNGGMDAFSGSARGVTARTNPASSFFTSIDNVSINNSGDVAFFSTEAAGGEGIFLEVTGAANPIPVIESGDPLFGSTVVTVSVGRFSLNERDEIAFRYQLANGRTGIAVASRRHGGGL